MKDPGRSSGPRACRTKLTLAACVAALLALPAAAHAAGTVTSDGSRVTYSGSSGNDGVLATYGVNDDEVGGPSVTIVVDSNVTNGSPGVCVQQSYSPTTVTCPRTSDVLLDLGAGDDEGEGEDGNEEIRGGDGNDHLIGGAGNDTLDGGTGNDGFEGTSQEGRASQREGADVINGGAGEDYVSYFDGSVAVNVSLDGVANDGPPGQGDNVGTDVENVYGSYADDTLTGSDASNKLYGLAGNDTIRGGGGDDLVDAGRDDDHVYGDAGADDLTGDHGDDFIEGGAGTDRLSGDGCSFNDCYVRSADTIQARDGERDLVTCGWNPDTVSADQADEVNSDCENVDRTTRVVDPPRPPEDLDPPAVDAAVSKKLKLKRVLAKGLAVQVSCDEACGLAGVATVSGSDARGLKLVPAATKTVAKGKKALTGAGKTTMVLKFTKKARKKLARKRKLKLKVTIAAVDTAGNQSGVQGTITLKR